MGDWTEVGGKLHRELEFSDFSEAWAFMQRVAAVAEELDHHPDWCNSWNKVTIDLFSHSAGAITDTDRELARRIDELVSPSNRRLLGES